MRIALVALILTLCLAATPATARWELSVERLAPDSVAVEVAVVRDGAGHAFKVYRDREGVVWALFEITDGLSAFVDSSCPTVQVDERKPISPISGPLGCKLTTAAARLRLGTIDNRRVRSKLLTQLIHGSSLYLRYRMPVGGYREAVFSLKRSKRALQNAIGAGVSVVSR